METEKIFTGLTPEKWIKFKKVCKHLFQNSPRQNKIPKKVISDIVKKKLLELATQYWEKLERGVDEETTGSCTTHRHHYYNTTTAVRVCEYSLVAEN